MKLKTFDKFSEEVKMEPDLYAHLYSFLLLNFNDINSQVDVDSMIYSLPSTLREEILFHQFGSIINTFKFFHQSSSNRFVWIAVRQLTKVSFG